MSDLADEQVIEVVGGARTKHGKRRPDYVRNPETTRDPPSIKELDAMRGRSGAKVWRKAREGKL